MEVEVSASVDVATRLRALVGGSSSRSGLVPTGTEAACSPSSGSALEPSSGVASAGFNGGGSD